MPQLIPTYWFSTLVFLCLIFGLCGPSKVLAHTFLNEPTSQNMGEPDMDPWIWPWP